MNAKCAAGTGKFLEIKANALDFRLEQFGEEALLAEKTLEINSTCTVFAESEVTSLMAKGENRKEIAMAVHRSVVKRVAGMVKRMGLSSSIVSPGGVANNVCIRHLLAEEVGQKLLVPENPQFIGAYGAALLAETGV